MEGPVPVKVAVRAEPLGMGVALSVVAVEPAPRAEVVVEPPEPDAAPAERDEP